MFWAMRPLAFNVAIFDYFTCRAGFEMIATLATVGASLVKRSCQTSSDGQNGIMLTDEGPCVPYSYGSSSCLQHDFIHDPKCSLDVDGALEGGGADYPAYCIHPWCYVDVQTCMQSDERLFRSGYFSENDGVHLVSFEI